MLHNIDKLDDYVPSTDDEKHIKEALQYLTKNNHLFRDFKSNYTLQKENLNYKDTKYDLNFKKNVNLPEINKIAGAFVNVDDYNIKEVDINQCKEGFVVEKNQENNDVEINEKFKIRNITWDEPYIEEMTFPWLFPTG